MRAIECGGRSLIIAAGRLAGGKEAILERAAALSGGRPGASVRLVDASRVFGMDHIRSALQKASRAFDNGTNVSDSLATETMLYMSGRRQIQEAVDMLGLRAGSKEMILLADAIPGMDEQIAKELPLREDESLLASIEHADLSDFGINEVERLTLPAEKQLELVLERVASVDIKKK